MADPIIINIGDLPTIDSPGLSMYATITHQTTGKTYKILYSVIRDFLGITALQGGIGNAVTSTVPLSNVNTYFATAAGTYSSFSGIVVSADDLLAGLVLMSKIGSTWIKSIMPVTNLPGYLKATDLGYDQVTIFRNTRIDTSTGLSYSDGTTGAYCSTDFLAINPTWKTLIRKATSAAVNVQCYNAAFAWLGAQAVGAGSEVQLTPLANTAYIKMGVSSNLSTREADIKAFAIRQYSLFGYDTTAPVRKVSMITGEKIIAQEVVGQSQFLVKENFLLSPSENIYRNNCRDGHYVYSNGLLDTGGSSAPSNYSMAEVFLDPAATDLSFFRRPGGPGVLGAFYSATGAFISAISGMSGITSGTFAKPAGAVSMLINVSSSLATRSVDKATFTLVYGTTVPQYSIAPKGITGLDGYAIYNRWGGKRIGINGMSITRASYHNVSPTPVQDVTTPYIILAALKLGMKVVENAAIGGSTYAVKESNPTERTPIVDRISTMNPNVDLLWFGSCTNDGEYDHTPFGTFSDRSRFTFCGATHLICQQARDLVPAIPIVMETPMKRYQAPYLTPDSVNLQGKTQKDYRDMQERICEYWGISLFDMYRASPVNLQLAAHRALYGPDGTHPNMAACEGPLCDTVVSHLLTI